MLVDSNIIVYAINLSSPKHLAAQQFLLANHNSLEIAHQNVLETFRILTHSRFPHPLTSSAALEAIDGITDACTIVYPDYHTLPLALAFITKHQLVSDQIFDAYLAATAITNGITTLATDNTRDFRSYTQLKLINPFVS